jgi:hypothetical protein
MAVLGCDFELSSRDDEEREHPDPDTLRQDGAFGRRSGPSLPRRRSTCDAEDACGGQTFDDDGRRPTTAMARAMLRRYASGDVRRNHHGVQDAPSRCDEERDPRMYHGYNPKDLGTYLMIAQARDYYEERKQGGAGKRTEVEAPHSATATERRVGAHDAKAAATGGGKYAADDQRRAPDATAALKQDALAAARAVATQGGRTAGAEAWPTLSHIHRAALLQAASHATELGGAQGAHLAAFVSGRADAVHMGEDALRPTDGAQTASARRDAARQLNDAYPVFECAVNANVDTMATVGETRRDVAWRLNAHQAFQRAANRTVDAPAMAVGPTRRDNLEHVRRTDARARPEAVAQLHDAKAAAFPTSVAAPRRQTTYVQREATAQAKGVLGAALQTMARRAALGLRPPPQPPRSQAQGEAVASTAEASRPERPGVGVDGPTRVTVGDRAAAPRAPSYGLSSQVDF